MVGNTESSWNDTAIPASTRLREDRPESSWPSRTMRPSQTGIRPIRARTSDDFRAPLWPKGIVTLTAAKRTEADLGAGQAQAAMLAIALHSAMALRRCRWMARAERR